MTMATMFAGVLALVALAHGQSSRECARQPGAYRNPP